MSRIRETAGCCDARLELDDVTDPTPLVKQWRDTHPCPRRPQPDGPGGADVERIRTGFTIDGLPEAAWTKLRGAGLVPRPRTVIPPTQRTSDTPL